MSFTSFLAACFILLAVVVASVGAGGSGGGGSGGGPFNPVEGPARREVQPRKQKPVFSINSFVGSVMGSLGALGSGLPQYLQESWGWEAVSSYKPLFALTILFSIVLFFVYSSISEQHQPRKVEKRFRERPAFL